MPNQCQRWVNFGTDLPLKLVIIARQRPTLLYDCIFLKRTHSIRSSISFMPDQLQTSYLPYRPLNITFPLQRLNMPLHRAGRRYAKEQI